MSPPVFQSPECGKKNQHSANVLQEIYGQLERHPVATTRVQTTKDNYSSISSKTVSYKLNKSIAIQSIVIQNEVNQQVSENSTPFIYRKSSLMKKNGFLSPMTNGYLSIEINRFCD